jgi:hypothetical protein
MIDSGFYKNLFTNLHDWFTAQIYFILYIIIYYLWQIKKATSMKESTQLPKKFIQSCYACFMSHKSSRKSIKKRTGFNK